MFHLKVVAVSCVFALALSSVKCSNEVQDSNELWLGENFDDFASVADTKPQVFRYFLKEPLSKDVSPRLDIKHVLGARVNGDRLLVQYKSPRKESGTAFNVNQVETFEFEATITYVEVVVNQSTNESKVTATSGGDGQKNIGLQIEGTNTLYFSYTTQIYGYY